MNLGRAAILVVVAAVALHVRLAGVDESYWVDELHTAWCAGGPWNDVGRRASAGNQSPLYFRAMWFWQQALGPSERAMRMSSVLATTASAVVLAGSLLIIRRPIAAGATGLLLAIDGNAVFFGTELRPYAAVMLVTSIWLAICVANSSRIHPSVLRPSLASRRLWWITVIAASTFGWFQPTALALPVAWLGYQTVGRGGLPRPALSGRSLAIGWTLVAVSAGCLWTMVLRPVWAGRGQWASFATASSWADWTGMWEWWPMILMPAAAVLIKRLWSSNRDRQDDSWFWIMWLSCVGVTMIFFVASHHFDIHLWHRRYLVNLIPVQCLVVGFAISRWERGTIASHLAAGGLAIATLGMLIVGQGGVSRIMDPPAITRGEDWRGAVSRIRLLDPPPREVWVDAGLIESSTTKFPLDLNDPSDREINEYLTYPCRSLYHADARWRAFSAADPNGWPDTPRRWVAIVRAPIEVTRKLYPGPGVTHHGFGGVTVVTHDATP